MSAQPFEPRVARLEGAYEQVDRRLEGLERRFDSLDRKLDENVESLRRDLGGQIEVVRDSVASLQWRITSLIVATWITVILAVLLHKT